MIDWNELFTYKDGKLFNKTKRGKSGVIGRQTGMCGIVRVDKVSYKTHRIIYEMHNGPIPEGLFIDHINRDPSDNRIENLRLATQFQNTQNTKGDGYIKRNGKFVARIKHNYKHIWLGTYDNPYEAHGAYLEAKKELCGEYAPQ